MTEPSPPSRQGPKRPEAAISELTLLVRVPGRPDLIRAFTSAEHDEAVDYAARSGGTIENLPQ